jgi:hypothetical protein
MALVDENGVPKTRPVPQQEHVDAGEKQAQYDSAVRVIMGREGLTWPEAAAKVDAEGAAAIMAAHNAPQAPVEVPESKTEPVPEKKGASWGAKSATTRKQ